MHYVIVGNGVAGITAAFTLREREATARITVISGETDYFFSRTALMYTFMDRMSPRDLEPYERKVYDRKKIERLRDWVVDLDANSRTLRLKSGTSLNYDRLLLATGSVPNSARWPGMDAVREGLAHFVSWQDLEECERLTASSRSAVIVGGGLIGVELAECLSFHGVKVTFLIRDPWYWPVALGGEEAEMITAHLRQHGIDVRLNESISEVKCSAEGRVSAIRTESGQEIACDFLGVCIGVHPAIDWLRQVSTPPRLGRGIQVTPAFETSLPDAWSAGDCAEIRLQDGSALVEQIWYSAKRQGELAAHAMLGDTVAYRPPIFYNSSKFLEIEFTTVGRVMNAPKGCVDFYRRIPGKQASIRILEHAGAVVGFNMLGARWDNGRLEQWIYERRPLRYVIEHLRQAQFDVEFGRLDLSTITA